MNNGIICVGPSGYDSTPPPRLDGDGACPYCHLAPCVVRQPPSWLMGSAAAALSNLTKRFKLYQKFLDLTASTWCLESSRLSCSQANENKFV